MFSSISDLELALYYDIPTYSVKNSDTTDRYGHIIMVGGVGVVGGVGGDFSHTPRSRSMCANDGYPVLTSCPYRATVQISKCERQHSRDRLCGLCCVFALSLLAQKHTLRYSAGNRLLILPEVSLALIHILCWYSDCNIVYFIAVLFIDLNQFAEILLCTIRCH